jgi:lipopolysaccharide/colanic/teichoic acid biosynthesis glycosyltransferase
METSNAQQFSGRVNHQEVWTFPRWKRGLDITIIILAMPIWLVAMIVIALGIKFISPGPVFFKQERVGFRGRRFWCLKFRSMKVNADTSCHEGHLRELLASDRPMTKLDASGDSRLIPFGKVFRATGLDELPQIFNVLRGEMSLVGPRPCTPHEFGMYEPWQRQRVNAPPGLTGYWQVNGKNKTTFTEMIAMDIQYSITMSPRMDVTILLKTFPAVLGQVYESKIAGPSRRAAVLETAMEPLKS